MIRPATYDDILAMVELGADLVKERKLPEIDKSATGDVIKAHIDGTDCFAAVAEIGDKIVAGLLLYRTKFWYSKQEFIADTVFYVSPAHRKSDLPHRLLTVARKWAQGQGLPLLLAVSTGEGTGADQLFSRAGLKKIGGLYLDGG